MDGANSMEQHSRRPQPLGAFPLPAGYLLVPDSDDPAVVAAREALVAGRLPASWPDELAVHRAAHEGRLDDARAALGDPDPATDPLAAYNRLVLDPDAVDAGTLGGLPEDLAPMVGVVAYAIGRSDVPPAPGAATGEVLALVLATRASERLDAGDAAGAVALLHDAADAAEPAGPALAGILLGNAAMIGHDHGLPDADPLTDLDAALRTLASTDLAGARAELHLQLGLLIHELAARQRRPLTDAVDQYYSALQLVGKAEAPHVWAAANLNLGAAYLTMPMVEASDQLRAGIAMQSLRASLEVFTKEDHPQEWASAQMNLANALVYTPSTHQGDNLVEAVERYEEVLELRERQGDPLGRARILANQGNALAHLGVFDHAKAKLHEARFIFEEHLDHESVMAVRSVLDEIAKQVVPDSRGPASGVPQGDQVAQVAAIRTDGGTVQ